ncbi:1,3-beta-glucan synthase regulator [Brevibacillus choshinensis]|uniref:1,3-beta-glucan synthase regulator n=1 Tax=Brevibacillus choshinensis TaxID=54911 RepID=A0ABR5N0C9_BRECH|nr:SMI1/KNR4 family protein [Brevibacillus choshinensis]KQL43947.1 1,3-beta-glucan synthase regulator [Brevibacillus choshinensis]
MNFYEWKQRIEIIAHRIREIGGDVQEIRMEEPASEEQVAEIERTLGFPLPTSFKKTLVEFSSSFSFRWFVPDDFELPGKFRGIFGGTPHWGLNLIQEFDGERKGWAENVFTNREDEYDAVWHNKLAFLAVGNGDYIAFDLNGNDDPPVVYLSHDDGEGHGYIIGENFRDFMDKWSRIAFVGAEDWQWIPFTMNINSGIVPDGEAANEFRSIMKLDRL